MLKEGKITYEKSRDRKFIIPECVRSLYPAMCRKLYEKILENGKLEFERVKSKEEIVQTIHGLLKLGQEQGHNIKPSDKMIQYFEEEFDIQCCVEFINRERRCWLWAERRHDPRYIEQDLPLASDENIEEIAESILTWGKIEDEIAEENAKKSSHKR